MKSLLCIDGVPDVKNQELYQVLQHQQGKKHSAVVAASKSQPRFRIAVVISLLKVLVL